MLKTGRWFAQRAAPADEDVISFTLGRLDSARSTLDQVIREWRRARRGAERGDPRALAAFRNMWLGLPGESGAADVDQLHERRERSFNLAGLAQVCAGLDVQNDRLVHVVLGFSAGKDVWLLDHGVTLGDPRDGDVWREVAAHLAQPFGGMPVSIVCADAGFLTTEVKRECSRRQWWVPTVGRAGEGKPIARRIRASGVCTMGADNASAWWSGRVQSGLHLPHAITRPEVAELCASEALTAEKGVLRWRVIDSRSNHAWDAAKLAIHGRHFRPLGGRRRRPLRLIAV